MTHVDAFFIICMGGRGIGRHGCMDYEEVENDGLGVLLCVCCFVAFLLA